MLLNPVPYFPLGNSYQMTLLKVFRNKYVLPPKRPAISAAYPKTPAASSGTDAVIHGTPVSPFPPLTPEPSLVPLSPRMGAPLPTTLPHQFPRLSHRQPQTAHRPRISPAGRPPCAGLSSPPLLPFPPNGLSPPPPFKVPPPADPGSRRCRPLIIFVLVAKLPLGRNSRNCRIIPGKKPDSQGFDK